LAPDRSENEVLEQEQGTLKMRGLWTYYASFGVQYGAVRPAAALAGSILQIFSKKIGL